MVQANITHAIGLDNLLSGAVDEAFQHEMISALRNIVDPNTVATQTRKVQLEFELKPSPQRDYAALKIKCKSTCGGNHNIPMETSLIITGSGEHVTATERALEQGSLFAGEKANV